MENWVKGFVFDDVQVLLELLVLSQCIEQLNAIHFLGLLQGCELDILRGEGFVDDWALNLRQIMGSHRSESSSPADVLMELVLEVNERIVGLDIELDVV